MRLLITTIIIILEACSENKAPKKEGSPVSVTSLNAERPGSSEKFVVEDVPNKSNGNARFKNVIAKKIGPDTYHITGEGQIFEASFNWVIEDGHKELQSGYATTDAGAPAWGKFNFLITIPRRGVNSELHLIIYEASAEDGRRQHELPILLK